MLSLMRALGECEVDTLTIAAFDQRLRQPCELLAVDEGNSIGDLPGTATFEILAVFVIVSRQMLTGEAAPALVSGIVVPRARGKEPDRNFRRISKGSVPIGSQANFSNRQPVPVRWRR
jgi:hypothetical protein